MYAQIKDERLEQKTISFYDIIRFMWSLKLETSNYGTLIMISFTYIKLYLENNIKE